MAEIRPDNFTDEEYNQRFGLTREEHKERMVLLNELNSINSAIANFEDQIKKKNINAVGDGEIALRGMLLYAKQRQQELMGKDFLYQQLIDQRFSERDKARGESF